MDIVSKSTGPKSTENFCCEICDFTTSRNSHYVRHIATRKHKMETEETFGNQKIPKNPSVFCCEKCYYESFSNKDFIKQVKTKNTFGNI